MDLSIIIPCYNEEKRLNRTLERVSEYLASKNYISEVVIVDNGSTDQTVAIAQSFMEKIKNLSIIFERHHGKGWAVREGMLYAKGKNRLFMDADNSTDIAQVEALLDRINAGFDVAIGSRKAPDAIIQNPPPLRRQVMSAAFSRLVRSIVPLGLKDTQNGFKLFRDTASEVVFPHQTIFYWAWDVEILAITKELGFSIAEVPITYVDDSNSTMRLGGMVRMLYEVIITRINLLTSSYVKNERRISERRTEERRGTERADREKDRRTISNRRA